MVLSVLKQAILAIVCKTKVFSAEELMAHWVEGNGQFFKKQFGGNISWKTGYGDMAAMYGYPSSHGLSYMPDLINSVEIGDSSIDVGWVEGISMHSGGTVVIKHFALNRKLTNRDEGYGDMFYNAMLVFFREHYSVAVEFRENHSSRIEHYRSFFSKKGVPEVSSRVWRVDLYPEQALPERTRQFQQKLEQDNR